MLTDFYVIQGSLRAFLYAGGALAIYLVMCAGFKFWMSIDDITIVDESAAVSQYIVCRTCTKWEKSHSRFNERREITHPCLESMEYMGPLDLCDEHTPSEEFERDINEYIL